MLQCPNDPVCRRFHRLIRASFLPPSGFPGAPIACWKCGSDIEHAALRTEPDYMCLPCAEKEAADLLTAFMVIHMTVHSQHESDQRPRDVLVIHRGVVGDPEGGEGGDSGEDPVHMVTLDEGSRGPLASLTAEAVQEKVVPFVRAYAARCRAGSPNGGGGEDGIDGNGGNDSVNLQLSDDFVEFECGSCGSSLDGDDEHEEEGEEGAMFVEDMEVVCCGGEHGGAERCGSPSSTASGACGVVGPSGTEGDAAPVSPQDIHDVCTQGTWYFPATSCLECRQADTFVECNMCGGGPLECCVSLPNDRDFDLCTACILLACSGGGGLAAEGCATASDLPQ